MSAQPVGTLAPDSRAWRAKASASKVAVMLGISPFDSPFSLWHRMNGNVPWEADNDTMRRGHYLEPAMRQWWRDQHPHLIVERTGTWIHEERDWQIATPDGLILDRDTREPVGILECKTSLNDSEWGDAGTDDIPEYYRVQALWTLDVLGLPVAEFSVLTSYFGFVSYTVPYDAERVAAIREQVRAFMDSLASGTPPDIDSHDQTYHAVKALHPDIEDEHVDVPASIALPYVDALHGLEVATAQRALATNRLALAIGNAKAGVYDGVTLATRQSRKGGAPYLVAGRNLSTRIDTRQKDAS